MKTITIPKSFGYPTVDVVINNAKHTLKSGEEITIEDYIAEVIENAMALAPKYARNISRFAQLTEGSLKELVEEDFGGISTIRECAFYNCDNLIKATIPNSIVKIEKNAFDWCGNLKDIYLPEDPPELTNINAFSNLKCTFYCKSQESLDAYKVATNWSELTTTHAFMLEG